MADFSVKHDPAARGFSVEADGHRGVVDYILRNGVMTITHTGVPSEIGGRGVAAALVQAALETARSKGWKVIPACSYAAVFIKRHPEYAVLLCDRP
ncbi:MAG: GNAT family N-acetyltransferase [Rhodanobacteraceae bacterium]